jgi:[acyl-carrier-protein] S-malonyltransferase
MSNSSPITHHFEEGDCNLSLAFVFPGQGSQYVGMGIELARHHRVAAEVFEQAGQVAGRQLFQLCAEGPAEVLDRTKYTQPAVFTASIAIMRVLRESGITCQAAAGHSLGEYSALVAAGVLPFAAALEIVIRRAELMDRAASSGLGGMAAVIGLEQEAAQEICLVGGAKGVVQPANFNAPNQFVISGERAALDEAICEARRRGARKVCPLSVSGAFHTSLMAGASDDLRLFLQGYAFSAPKVTLVMNASGGVVSDPGVIKELLAVQVSSPVLWEESVKRLAKEGFKDYLEVGPGQVLSGLVRRIVPECRVDHVEDEMTLEKTLEKLLARTGGTV